MYKPTSDPLRRHYKTPEESFAARTRREGNCLIWLGETRKPSGYGIISTGNGGEDYVHRWVWTQHNGDIPAGIEIDHQCHRHNCAEIKHLRKATRKQNQENRDGLDAKNTSGYRGVSWDKSRNKWMATIGHNGKVKNLGRYNTAEEAAEVSKKARLQLFTHNDGDKSITLVS